MDVDSGWRSTSMDIVLSSDTLDHEHRRCVHMCTCAPREMCQPQAAWHCTGTDEYPSSPFPLLWGQHVQIHPIGTQSRSAELLTMKTVVRKNQKNDGQNGSQCLDKAASRGKQGLCHVCDESSCS